ncbi:helix-turn-helix domain-containing protein [Yinghuangia sp. YIM S09857]|uniref:helix-turn-helix domain-containing protein n=1 Tax=Yinghuangia sp. YIM S09857 TaxID=3436929 RepID=UPI003F534CC4
MQIAKQLEALRGDLTQQQVADRADVSKATVSRYEDWTNTQKIVPRTVRVLCDALGAPSEVRDALVALAKELDEPGWWVGKVPPWMTPFVSLETEASTERVFSSAYIPGLLQTRAYAEATHLALEPRATRETVRASVDARMERQKVLTRDPQPNAGPLRLWVILEEGLLHRQVGGPSVMAEQISHLIEQAERPNVDIQMLPYAQGAHAAVSSFVLFGDGHGAASAVYVELLKGGLYFHKDPELGDYIESFERLCSQAASLPDSLKILAKARKEFA